MTRLNLLIVDDDRELATTLTRYLSQHGINAVVAADSAEMDRLLSQTRFDLMVLDLMLPGEDGLSIARRIGPALPFIILSARGEEADRIVGLELGADDYLAKPFSARELTARIHAVLRRREKATAVHHVPVYAFGPYRLDTASHTLTKNLDRVRITSADYVMLKIFCSHPNQVISRERLMALAGEDGRLPFDRSIDVRITRLRQKIEDNAEDPCYIRTVRGAGYLFAPGGCG